MMPNVESGFRFAIILIEIMSELGFLQCQMALCKDFFSSKPAVYFANKPADAL